MYIGCKFVELVWFVGEVFFVRFLFGEDVRFYFGGDRGGRVGYEVGDGFVVVGSVGSGGRGGRG